MAETAYASVPLEALHRRTSTSDTKLATKDWSRLLDTDVGRRRMSGSDGLLEIRIASAEACCSSWRGPCSDPEVIGRSSSSSNLSERQRVKAARQREHVTGTMGFVIRSCTRVAADDNFRSCFALEQLAHHGLVGVEIAGPTTAKTKVAQLACESPRNRVLSAYVCAAPSAGRPPSAAVAATVAAAAV